MNVSILSESLPQIDPLFIYSNTEEINDKNNRYQTTESLIDIVEKS
jgi:hypothetical protein